MPTPQFADWLEGARDASDRAAREPDARRRVVLARRAANGWERAANVLLERRGRDWWPDAAALLRRAAADWEVAGNPRVRNRGPRTCRATGRDGGPGRRIPAADPRPWPTRRVRDGPPHR